MHLVEEDVTVRPWEDLKGIRCSMLAARLLERSICQRNHADHKLCVRDQETIASGRGWDAMDCGDAVKGVSLGSCKVKDVI